MATLASQSCGKVCNEDADFALTFLINSLTLANADKYSEDEKVLTITWGGNLIRTIALDSLEKFQGHRQVINVHCTPMQLNQKLKSNPLLMNLTAFCENLGTVKFPLTDCFCDAVLCNDFNSQVLSNDFKFIYNEVENGTIDVDLKIEKLKSQEAVSDAFKKARDEAAKRKRKKAREQYGSDDDDEDDEALCRGEFLCPNELPEYCKKHLDLDEHSYRIINGHLVNTKDKRGYCGNVCETAMKYCKEIQKVRPSKVLSLDLQKLFQKRTENVPKIPSDVFYEISKLKFTKKDGSPKAVIHKKLSSEITQKKTPKIKTEKKKKTNKKSVKKEKICKSKSTSPPNEECNRPRQEFISKMKYKAVGKYSYEFGNSYPFHRSSCSVPNICEKVPSHMGWRHDKVNLNTRYTTAWQPGKVNKIVRCLMKHFLRPYPYDTINTSKPNRKQLSRNNETEGILQPTLQLSKRNGEIAIQMRPLKDNKELTTDCNPYLNCSPLKFMIKKHPDEIKMHKARKLLKLRGIQKKCNCCDIKFCRCISSIRKEMFKHEMRKVSRELNMKNEIQYEDVHDTSDSEIDFEFTPPTVLNSKNRCKPDVAHAGTQYDYKHFLMTKKEKTKLLEQNQARGCINRFK